MNNSKMYDVIFTKHFKRQLKALVKKDRLLKERLKQALLHFDKRKSIAIVGGVYKIRIAGHHSGKSSGYRAYLFVMEIEGIIAPVSIYAKSDVSDLTQELLIHHLNRVEQELATLL